MPEYVSTNAARTAKKKRECTLTIGHTPCTDSSLVLSLLTIQMLGFPRVGVQLHSDFAFDLVQSLLTRELDLALVAWPPEGTGLKLVEIVRTPLYAVLPEYHPASENDEVSLSELINDHWIIFNRRVHPLLFDALLQRATAYGISPTEIHHIVTPEEGIHLVLEDAGVALLAKPAAVSSQRLGVVVKPLAEDTLQIRTYLAMRADESSRIVADFAEQILRRCSSDEPLGCRWPTIKLVNTESAPF